MQRQVQGDALPGTEAQKRTKAGPSTGSANPHPRNHLPAVQSDKIPSAKSRVDQMRDDKADAETHHDEGYFYAPSIIDPQCLTAREARQLWEDAECIMRRIRPASQLWCLLRAMRREIASCRPDATNGELITPPPI